MTEISSNEIKSILKKKKVLYGLRESKKALESGKAENIIIASESIGKEHFKDSLEFKGNSKDLGMVCGKPFNISAIAVLKE